jgi:hypothetical protein
MALSWGCSAQGPASARVPCQWRLPSPRAPPALSARPGRGVGVGGAGPRTRAACEPLALALGRPGAPGPAEKQRVLFNGPPARGPGTPQPPPTDNQRRPPGPPSPCAPGPSQGRRVPVPGRRDVERLGDAPDSDPTHSGCTRYTTGRAALGWATGRPRSLLGRSPGPS